MSRITLRDLRGVSFDDNADAVVKRLFIFYNNTRAVKFEVMCTGRL